MKSAKFAPQSRPTRNPVPPTRDQMHATAGANAWLASAGYDVRTGLERKPRAARPRTARPASKPRRPAKVIPVTIESE